MANVEIPKWLKNLPLAPVFRPTDTEFADPIAYISKIEKEAGAFGICKVIPPLPKPSKRYVLGNLNKSLSKSRDLGLDYNATEPVGDSPNTVAEGKAVFTTRQQELGKSQSLKRSRDASCLPLSVGQKQVWQSGEVYTLEQFESKSKVFSRSVLGSIKEVTPQVIEALFWKASSEKPIYVEYANDVPGSGFGEPDRLLSYYHGRKRRRRTEYGGSNLGRSGCARQHFNTLGNSVCGGVVESPGQSSCSISETVEQSADNPTSISDEASHSGKQSVSHANGELEGTAGWKLSNSPWNLQVIARSAGSLTRFLLDDIPGVTSPMVYIGMLFSWFAWHVEDHELHSLNFLHLGSPKTWYAVPGDYAFAFEEIIRTQAYGRDIDRLAALKFLGEKTTLLSPELVVASGIPCCRLVQNPGEFVVTFPRAYHVGFSHGFNCGEAANFGTPQWLTVAKDAAIRRAAMDHLPMLSHQQLLYLLTMSFIPRVPRSLLPGVRSSRLKDRLKEERELLVKKAFIKDVLKENKLLKTLSERCFTFRAVLWHPDLLPSIAKESIFQVDFLPSVAKESVPQSGNIQESIPKKDELPVTAVKNSNQDTFVHEITSCAETASDLYNCDDLSCDFQVDSGALPCVACGVLGYPLMSVIQPSTKAAAELFPTERLRITGTVEIGQESKSPYLHQLTNCAVSAINVEETQDTPAFLKPRIFCLEHAIQIEELLRTKGGSKILVICHSDYQKVKVNAATVAEDIRTVFDHKEVPLDSASMEELSLIDIAIEHEQLTDCQEDWTSKLGMNLRYSIKVRTDSSKEIGALNPGYLLSVIAPGSMISSIKWGARKSRTRRESNNQKQRKSCCGDRSNKDETIHESVRSMERRDKVILQYSRRKYRARSRDSGAKCASTSVMNCLLNVADANCGKTDASEVETSVASFVRNIDVDSVELYTLGSTEHFEVQHDEVDVAEPNRNSATSIVHADPVYQHRDTTLQVNLPMANKTSCEVTVATEASTSTSDNSMSLREAGQGNEANNVNDNLASDKCSCSTAVGMLADEKRWNCVYNNIQNDGDSMKADEGMAMVTLEEPSNKQLMGNSVLEKASAKLFEVHDSATSNVSVSKTANETCKYDISVCMESTITVEVSKPAHLENQKNSCQIGIQGCSLQGDSKHDMGRTANTKVVSSGKSKRAREVAQTDILNDFVISPCERLRPRKKTEDPPCTSSHNTLSETQQKPPRKMIKKSSGSSGSHMDVMDGKGPYECNLEGCRLRFKTKTELSLHKRNKCHYEECGKRFRSHKYVVLHQRVHDDKRPLKCMWKGCGMTFKWAWARTEHLRLHTGERPYECKIEGCGRTFRFVSDFSRHRRKTGHYI